MQHSIDRRCMDRDEHGLTGDEAGFQYNRRPCSTPAP
jgi:hypothetical protein